MAPLPILCRSAVAAETLAQACEGFKIIWSFAEQQEAPAELGGARFLCFAQRAAVQWGQGSCCVAFLGFSSREGVSTQGQRLLQVSRKEKGLRSSFSGQMHQLEHEDELSRPLMCSHRVGTLAASQ